MKAPLFSGDINPLIAIAALALTTGYATAQGMFAPEKPDTAAVQRAMMSVVSVNAEVSGVQATRITDPNVVMIAPPTARQGIGFLVATSEKDSRTEFALVPADLVIGARRISIRLADNRITSAELYAWDGLTNVALLRIGVKDAHGLAWTDSERLPAISWGGSIQPGKWVGGSIDGIVKVGAAANVQRSFRYVPILRFACQAGTFSMGSPIVNAQGRGVGVLCGVKPAPPLPLSPLPGPVVHNGGVRVAGAPNVAYALPSSYVQRLVADLLQYRTVRHPWVGLRFADSGGNRGAIIVEVTPDSPAFDAGLRATDVVQKANGQPVRNGIDLARVITQLTVGSQLQLVVLRSAEIIELPQIAVKSQVQEKQAN